MNKNFNTEIYFSHILQLVNETDETLRHYLKLEKSLKLFWRHKMNELLVGDVSLAVNVSLTDNDVHLLLRKFLTHCHEDMLQLTGCDGSIAILVEHTKRFTDLLGGLPCEVPAQQ